jgi:hypothetical protein
MSKLALSLLVLGLLACGGQGGDDPAAQSTQSTDGAAPEAPRCKTVSTSSRPSVSMRP